MAYQPGFMFHPSTAVVSTLTFVASRTATSGASIAFPTGSQAGDLCILIDTPRNNTSSTPSSVDLTGSGWTQIGTDETGAGGVSPGTRTKDWYKILTSGDISTGSVTGMTGTNDDTKLIFSFRPDNPIAGVTAVSVQSAYTGSNPTLQTITPTFAPAVLMALMRGSATLGGENGTLTTDGTLVTTSSTSCQAYYLVQNGSVTSKTVDFGDVGTWNLLQSWAVQVT